MSMERSSRSRSRRARPRAGWARFNDEAGFSLVELLVAILILSVGLVSLTTLQFQSAAVTRDTKAREGATNLAREVVETIVASSYSGVEPETVSEVLKSKPELAPDSRYSGWTVLRRDIPYGISAGGCYVDDPSDGRGSHEGSFCDTQQGTTDSEPIDYKRFGVTVSWTRNGIQRSITQTTLLVPKGESPVPSITSLTSSSGTTITDSSVTSVAFTATTSARAAGVAWSLDGGIRGTAAGSGSSWSFTWNISGLPDGQYVVGAQAYNSSGTYGKSSALTVTLNRSRPAAPMGFNAGWNPHNSKVDTEWLANSDQDTVGYTVYRLQTGPVQGSVTKVNCGTVAEPAYVVTDTACTDAEPIMPGGSGVITFRSSEVVLGNNVSNVKVTAPANVAAGDVLVATVAVAGTPNIILPAGWTLIRATELSGKHKVASYYRVAGSSEPKDYTFEPSSGKWDMAAGVSAYRGVDTSAPIDVSNASTGSSGNAVSPSVTTGHANDLLINPVAFASVPGGSTVSPPAGFTERYDVLAKNMSHAVADQAQAAAGASGTKTAAPSGANAGWISQLIALKPSSATSGTITVYYAVVALDRGALGELREGSYSNAVNAYAPNQRPYAVSGSLSCTSNGDGSKTLGWTQPSQPGDPDSGDSIDFNRVYRDGNRHDRTGTGTENTYTDPAPGGTRTYYVTTVDTHMAESTPSVSVTC